MQLLKKVRLISMYCSGMIDEILQQKQWLQHSGVVCFVLYTQAIDPGTQAGYLESSAGVTGKPEPRSFLGTRVTGVGGERFTFHCTPFALFGF